LWPETLESLDYLKQYQMSDSVYVVLNTAGTPLNKGAKKGNDNQVILLCENKLPGRGPTEQLEGIIADGGCPPVVARPG
jgi:hypothetical protein